MCSFTVIYNVPNFLLPNSERLLLFCWLFGSLCVCSWELQVSAYLKVKGMNGHSLLMASNGERATAFLTINLILSQLKKLEDPFWQPETDVNPHLSQPNPFQDSDSPAQTLACLYPSQRRRILTPIISVLTLTEPKASETTLLRSKQTGIVSLYMRSCFQVIIYLDSSMVILHESLKVNVFISTIQILHIVFAQCYQLWIITDLPKWTIVPKNLSTYADTKY